MKVYIIDEVHMLSSHSFNALLKTLEEPPPHVVFIFATTEVHKIPVTILSRCQRFDFKLIATVRLTEHLQGVLAKENIAADEEAVRVIARQAAGSVRDGLSLLDQAIAYVGDAKLTRDDRRRRAGRRRSPRCSSSSPGSSSRATRARRCARSRAPPTAASISGSSRAPSSGSCATSRSSRA